MRSVTAIVVVILGLLREAGADETFHMRTRDGEIREVPADALASAIDQGWTMASREEVAAAESRAMDRRVDQWVAERESERNTGLLIVILVVVTISAAAAWGLVSKHRER